LSQIKLLYQDNLQYFPGLHLTATMEEAKARKAQLVLDKQKFQETLPKIINQVIGAECSQTKEATEHFRQVCSTE
jgi:hypothetical protein